MQVNNLEQQPQQHLQPANKVQPGGLLFILQNMVIQSSMEAFLSCRPQNLTDFLQAI